MTYTAFLVVRRRSAASLGVRKMGRSLGESDSIAGEPGTVDRFIDVAEFCFGK